MNAHCHDLDTPHLQSQVKLENDVRTTLPFVLKEMMNQLKSLLAKQGVNDETVGDSAEPVDSSALFSPLNFTLSLPAATSSVHIVFFISELLKQLQRLERIEQVEIRNEANRRMSKRKSRINSIGTSQTDGSRHAILHIYVVSSADTDGNTIMVQ